MLELSCGFSWGFRGISIEKRRNCGPQEKIQSLREDLKLQVGSKEECEELTSAGIYLRTAPLTPDPETGIAAFSLQVPVVPQERVCTVALADCALAQSGPGPDIQSMHHHVQALLSPSGRKGVLDKFLHRMTSHHGVMPPIMGLGVFGMLPGLVSGIVSVSSQAILVIFDRF